VHKFDFSDEEIMAYYISFLKTLSLKLNNHTVHFFYNEVRWIYWGNWHFSNDGLYICEKQRGFYLWSRMHSVCNKQTISRKR